MRRLATTAVIHLLALVLSPHLAAAELPAGVAQRVLIINAMRGGAKNFTFTVKDCANKPDCYPSLAAEIEALGGDPELMKTADDRIDPIGAGDTLRFNVTPSPGTTLCRAALLRMSISPTVGDAAPEVTFSASAASAEVMVKLPEPGVWYDGVLIVFAAKPDAAGVCTLKEAAQTDTCKGMCGTTKF